MGLGALRSIIGPLPRTVISRVSTASCCSSSQFLKRELRFVSRWRSPWFPISNHFHSLTDTRYPKRRPVDNPRRKRTSLRSPGPYAWLQYTPGQPISPNNPNEGCEKRRNERKRMKQRLAFILAEAKKRKAQLQEAKSKKKIMRIERKIAAVARERTWAQRLAEVLRLEEEKKKSMA